MAVVSKMRKRQGHQVLSAVLPAATYSKGYENLALWYPGVVKQIQISRTFSAL